MEDGSTWAICVGIDSEEGSMRKGRRINQLAGVAGWSSRTYGWPAAAAGALGMLLICQPAHAFKMTTHVASANLTEDQLAGMISATGPSTLVFTVKGQRLEVPVATKDAYLAVIRHPDFFRAGAIGPDGFPDLITGQMVHHGNESPTLKSWTHSAANELNPPTHGTTDPFESREGPAEMRAIDFAMALLTFANSGAYTFDGPSNEREKVIAYIMGYFSHGVGDGFAHTWINEIAGGAWDLGRGGGMWGTSSEEVRHIAVESLVDSRVPQPLLSSPGSSQLDRVAMAAPARFLDAFYSTPTPHAIPFGNRNGDINDFVGFYRNLDLFFGGPFYNYFNLQADAPGALVNWSQVKPLFDFAQKFQLTGFENTLLDVANIPAEVAADLQSWFQIPAINIDLVGTITGGYAKCSVDNGHGSSGGGGPNPTTLDTIRAVWTYLGSINARVAKAAAKAQIVRQNWVKLNQCTSENLSRIKEGAFNPATPTLNRDACAVLADAPWVDQGNADGLTRGAIRAETDALDKEFLDNLKLAFRGGDVSEDGVVDFSKAFEPNNLHRRIDSNVTRLFAYLLGPGLTLKDLPEAFISDRDAASTAGGNILGEFHNICAAARDPAVGRCVDFFFAPFALAGLGKKCIDNTEKCLQKSVTDCLTGVCLSGCPSIVDDIIDCSDVCALGGSVCHQVCDDALCGFLGCVPFVHDACIGVCDFISGGDPSCIPNTVTCGTDAINCSLDAFQIITLQKGYGQSLFKPVRDVCDQVDQALALFEILKDPAKRRQWLKDHGVPVDLVDKILGDVRSTAAIARSVAAQVAALPPEYFVNFAFLDKDMQQDPAYLLSISQALDQKRNELNAQPPSPDRTSKLDTLNRFQRLVDGIRTGNPVTLIEAAADPKGTATLVQNAVNMGLISSLAGPTAKRILGDIGPDFNNTFNAFFNTAEGMRLVPLDARADIDGTFVAQAVGTTLLPWNQASLFSAHCTTGLPNVYCDAIPSFDDPNSLNASLVNVRPTDILPNPARHNWVPGRGVVAWNPYDSTGRTADHIATNFPFATNDPAYNQLYTRIFLVPDAIPKFAGFEDDKNPWTDTTGQRLTPNTSNRTQGRASVQIEGCGFVDMNSPFFRTADWGVVSNKLSVDVFVPANAPRAWSGDVQMFVTIPGVTAPPPAPPPPSIFNLPLGLQSLTQSVNPAIVYGAWNTLTFGVPDNVQKALLGDWANAQIKIDLNLPCGAAFYLIDNLRFTGIVTNRVHFHSMASQNETIQTAPPLDLDDATAWTVVQNGGPLATVLSPKTQGIASVSVPARGFTEIRSRAFSTPIVPNATNKLNLDLFIPSPQPNQFWTGQVQLFLTCGSMIHQPIGQAELTNLFPNEFNSLTFTLPSNAVSTLRAVHTGCTMGLVVNVLPSGGSFLVDNLGFIQ
jgi:hypothetical protein